MLPDFETVIGQMECTGDFKILRRMLPRLRFPPPPPEAVLAEGIVLDVETTGLSYENDEVIQLGMVRFTYDKNTYAIHGVGPTFERLRQPTIAIPPDVTRLTGITDEQVLGKEIQPFEVEDFIRVASVVIAFNADFDRKFAEKLHPVFVRLPWACAMADIPWKEEGFDGKKLRYLLMQSGLFYSAHTALEDCFAVLEMLIRPLPISGISGLMALKDASRSVKNRIMVVNSIYEFKDQLKARGYKFHDEGNFHKYWWTDIAIEATDLEISFINENASKPGTKITVKEIDAWNRFSDRAYSQRSGG